MGDAVFRSAEADLAAQALKAGDGERQAAANLPPWPQWCEARITSGVTPDDRQDVALKKTDAALGRANKRAAQCGSRGFYGQVRLGRAPGKGHRND